MTRVPRPVLGVVLDVDGVLLHGRTPVPRAAEAVAGLEVPVVIATNNASRSSDDVAALLSTTGIRCAPDQVLTSARVAANHVQREHPGARVLSVGSRALGEELVRVGLVLVEDPLAADVVVQGFAPGTTAADLGRAVVAVRRGAAWVATNADPTLPSELGPVPGNGALIDVVAAATGMRPVVTGKPSSTFYREALRRLGDPEPARVLAVGDRLSTDVRGANAAGLSSVLVRTGIDATTPLDATTVPRADIPAAVLEDLAGLPGLVLRGVGPVAYGEPNHPLDRRSP